MGLIRKGVNNDDAMNSIAPGEQSRADANASFDVPSDRFPTFQEELPRSGNADQVRPKRLRINCPHCSNAIVVVVLGGENDGHCSVCGSSFEIESQSEKSWSSKQLPKLGKFQLLQVVGRGAFGTVYQARDTDLERIVAVKVPRSGRFAGPEDEDRFMREARSVAQLNHPGIVPVYEVGHADELPYIVAEYVEGVTLNELLQYRRLEFVESADIVASIAEALSHAHERGVIHRDLKPGNILLERWGGVAREESVSALRISQLDSRRNDTLRTCGRARLMDFGLARRDSGEASVTVEGQLLGTPAYMSPEQARGDVGKIDVRSDVYSLGVMLFEMLTGELPFRGTSRMVIEQVIHNDPPSPRKLVSHLPSDLETICMTCMQKDPAKRYQTASQLADELHRFLTGQPILARRISSLDRARRWCQRNPVVSSLASLLILSLLAGLFGVATQWRRAERNSAMAREQAERANLVASQASESAASEREARRRAEQSEVRAEATAKDATRKSEVTRRVSEFLVEIFPGPDDSRYGDRSSQDAANACAVSGLTRYTQGDFEASVEKLRKAVSLYERLHDETDSRAIKLNEIIDLILLESECAGSEPIEAAVAVRKQFNTAE